MTSWVYVVLIPDGSYSSFSLFILSGTWDFFSFMFIFWSKLCIWSFWCYILSCVPMCSECWEGSDINSATLLASSLWAVPTPFRLIWHSLMMARSWRAVEATIIVPVRKSTQVEHLGPHGFMYTWLACKSHSPHGIGGRQEACPKPQILELLVRCIPFYPQPSKQKQQLIQQSLLSTRLCCKHIAWINPFYHHKTPWATFEAQILESWPRKHTSDLSLSSASHPPQFPLKPFLLGCPWCVQSILYH